MLSFLQTRFMFSRHVPSLSISISPSLANMTQVKIFYLIPTILVQEEVVQSERNSTKRRRHHRLYSSKYAAYANKRYCWQLNVLKIDLSSLPISHDSDDEMLHYCAELLRCDQGKLSENGEEVCHNFTDYSLFKFLHSGWSHSADMGIASWLESICAISY